MQKTVDRSGWDEYNSFCSQRNASGGIAQLGERLNGIQEVSGSIPLISTNKTMMKDLELHNSRSLFSDFLSNFFDVEAFIFVI